MAQKHYTCGYCYRNFARKDVLPPIGAVRPPGVPWRCRECHPPILRSGLMEAATAFFGKSV